MAGAPLISRTASPATAGVVEDAVQLVTFYLGGEEYALGITRVREIIGTAGTTRLPHSPRHVMGLINLRGEVIPVFDMRRWFGLATSLTEAKSTIIAEWRDERFGFTVDAVHQVVWLRRDAIDPPTTHFQERSPYIMGLGKYQNRILILLDLDSLFKDVEEEAQSLKG
ncbi:MAG: chemotaxis protein CheW [Candidatus Sericytochromatia bacterium]|uniref:Chemotaxis protein CheW n=1 Tax=Candidatus Tanganyikabacteria bacterium TaxID=2961651 RepID=A0A937X4V4_9BACT|nr:chemotaxis protein CheW [Candidatus Tanganyikabacteria bacterium]